MSLFSRCKKKCRRIPIQRYFLPTTGVVGIVILEEVRNFIYLPLVFIYASIVMFWNFPSVLYFTSSKPIFIEDLFVDNTKIPDYDVDPRIKKKFQLILEWTLIATNSLFVGALADFWLYKTSDMDNITEIAGVTGGILKLFQTCNHLITSLLMMVIRKHIVKESNENKRIRNKKQKSIQKQNVVHSVNINPYKNSVINMTSPIGNKNTNIKTTTSYEDLLKHKQLLHTKKVVKALSPKLVRKNVLNTIDTSHNSVTNETLKHRIVSPTL